MTLRSLAQELTEPHLKSIGGRIGKVPALLQELREAISGSSSGDGGGGNNTKQRVLVNASALDLLNTITRETRDAYTHRYGIAAPTLETCIQQIANGEHPPDWETYFKTQYAGFIHSIETMLRPKKKRRLDNVECPSCGQSKHGEERETCLYLDCYTGEHKDLKHPNEWEVTCAACDATWTRDKMSWLLVALAGD